MPEAVAPPEPAPPPPRIALSPCHLEGLPEEVLCGRHEVFEDRAARAGRRIALRVAVIPALRREPRPDPVVLYAGGPGQGATRLAALAGMLRPLRRARDLVLVDRRGTGDSAPLACDPGDPLETLGGLSGAALFAACRASLAVDPLLYGTAAAVDDLDEVRAALGYERVNLWGGSCGTRAALVYARRHPDRVRSVVLDGAAPFGLRLPLHGAAGADRALGKLTGACAADPACSAAWPALGTRIDALLARLEERPARVTIAHPRTGAPRELLITRAVLASGLRGFLYSPLHSSLVPLVIDRAAAGDYGPFAALVLETSSWSVETMSPGLTPAVICVEEVPRIAEDGIAGALPVPALVLSGDLDPVTPPAWGEVMRAHFTRARHVVVPAAGHSTSFSGCLPELIARFYGNPEGDLDTACVARIARPPFVVGPAGPRP